MSTKQVCQKVVISAHKLECIPEDSSLFPSYQCTETDETAGIQFCAEGAVALGQIVRGQCTQQVLNENLDDGFRHGRFQQNCRVEGEVQIKQKEVAKKGLLQRLISFFSM